MRILSKYLLKQHLVPFVFAVSALTAFQLLNQIARQFGNLVGKGLPWSVIVEVFVLSIPFIVTTTLSMAVLMAVLYAVGRLAADHELVAMRAGGISMGRLMVPLLATASVVAVLAFLFSDQVLPRSNHRLRTLMTDIGRKKPTFSLKEQVINEVQRNRFFLRAARINQSTFALRDVTIYDLGDQLRKRIIYADSGYMALSPDQETLYLTLYDGVTHEADRTDPHSFQQIEFRKDVIRVSGVGNVLTRTTQDNYKGDREMGVCEMESVIRTADHEAIQYRARERDARLNAVRGLVGLAPITPDTAAPIRDYSPYCRVLQHWASWLLPADAEAQQPRPPARATPAAHRLPQQRPARQPPDSVNKALLSGFNEPARRAYVTGRVERPHLADLLNYADRARSARLRAANFLVEVHKKYAIAAACIVFVLIGVPAALQFASGGIGFVIGVSLTVFTVFYVGLIGGESLANRLIVSPFWAMWTPNILFAVIGLAGLWRMRRATSAILLPERMPRWLAGLRWPWRRRRP
jgi:lipopolysaccharide export system permease protein